MSRRLRENSLEEKCCHCGLNAHGVIGGSYFCVKHLRFIRMRGVARTRRVAVPTMSELENMLVKLNGFKCPGCDKKMIWRMGRGLHTVRVISLQHNRDGSMGFLCLRCNSLHRAYPGDSFYTRDRNKKYCRPCGKEVDLNRFYNVIQKNGRAGKMARCGGCESKRVRLREAM